MQRKSFEPTSAGYPDAEQIRVFRRQVLARVEALPGVVRASWVSARALADGFGTTAFEIEQAPPAAEGEVPWAFHQSVGPAYFDMMHLAPRAGRLLNSSDGPDASRVAVVNATAAARYWPESEVVGQRIRRTGGEWLTVVGIVADEVFPDPENPSVPQLYTAVSQRPQSGAALVVEAVTDPLQLAVPIRQAIWSIDPEQPVADVRTQKRILADSLADVQAVASMFGSFALFALVIAAAGIYGVLSFVVAQRTREIGIRMALGADRSQVRGMVMLNSAWLIGAGVLLGLAGAVALVRLLSSGIHEINAADPVVYSAVALVFLVVAAVSAWLPARRATRVQPVVALRAE